MFPVHIFPDVMHVTFVFFSKYTATHIHIHNLQLLSFPLSDRKWIILALDGHEGVIASCSHLSLTDSFALHVCSTQTRLHAISN